jgi:hypothetical protein
LASRRRGHGGKRAIHPRISEHDNTMTTPNQQPSRVSYRHHHHLFHRLQQPPSLLHSSGPSGSEPHAGVAWGRRRRLVWAAGTWLAGSQEGGLQDSRTLHSGPALTAGGLWRIASISHHGYLAGPVYCKHEYARCDTASALNPSVYHDYQCGVRSMDPRSPLHPLQRPPPRPFRSFRPL